MLDAWWSSETRGVWVSGPAGAGKTSLVLTWLRAVQKIGYEHPLRTHVQGWSFYVAPFVQELEDFCRATFWPNQVFLLDGLEALSAEDRNKAIGLVLSHGARFVTTSREALPGQYEGYVTEIALTVLAHADAMLLLSRVTPAASGEALAAVIERLGSSPLALSLVAAQLKDGRVTPERLITELEEGSFAFFS